MGFIRGAMFTAAIVSQHLDNARTKKDIRRIYQETTDTNYVNRGVLALPHVNKQQLLLTTKDAADNDVYDYKANSSTPGIDYIWGEFADSESTVISGGKSDARARALMPFVNKSQGRGIPIIALHSGNRELEMMLEKNSVACEIISKTGLYYNGFRTLPVEDMAYLLFETMPEDTSPNAESVIRALLEILLRIEGKVSFQNLATFPLVKLMTMLDDLKADGRITADEHDDISADYMAGSSEVNAVRSFLSRLNRQADSIFGKSKTNAGNIRKILNQKGVVAIDVGVGGNELVISFMLNHIRLLQTVGREFAIIIDGLTIGKHEGICDVLRGGLYAICHNDFVSSLHSGERSANDLFSELTGDVRTIILLNHNSGTSCQKWSEHLGKYHKIRIKMNISSTTSMTMGGNTRGITVDEEDEPRVRAETLSMLPEPMACINRGNETLFAEV